MMIETHSFFRVSGVNSYKPPGSFQWGRIPGMNGREGATPGGKSSIKSLVCGLGSGSTR